MKQIYIMCMMLGLILQSQIISSAAGGNIPVTTIFCGTGNEIHNVNCQFGSLNAVGDEIVFNKSNVFYPKKFRTLFINESQRMTLVLPKKDTSVGYRITFSGGKLAGKELLFIGIIEKGIDDNNNTKFVYKFYNRTPSGKNDIWYEVGRITTSEEIKEIPCFLTSDGSIIFINNMNLDSMNIQYEKL